MKRMVRKTALIFATLVFVATLAMGEAQAAEFVVIITNLNNTNGPHAQVDVSLNTGVPNQGEGYPILFNVYTADGTQITAFEMLTGQNGFVSSSSAAPPNDNLFAVSGGLPALVRVRTPEIVVPAAVTLRQTLGKSEIVFGVPALLRYSGTTYQAAGAVFSVALGDIAPRATLLICNVSGTDAIVDVWSGTDHAPGTGKYTNHRLTNRAIWIVHLDQSDANTNVLIRGSTIVVQLAVDNGKKGISWAPLLPF